MSRNGSSGQDEAVTSEAARILEEFLNLDEEHAQIYAALLTVNGATLGQIAELSGHDVITVARVLEDLLSQGLVKSHGGKLSWYVATSPFIPATISLLDVTDLMQAQHVIAKLKQEITSELLQSSASMITNEVTDEGIAHFLQERVMKEIIALFSDRLDHYMTFVDKILEKNLLKIRTLRMDLERLHKLQLQLLSREIVQRWTYPITGEGEMLIALRDAVQASQRAARDLILFMPQLDLKTLKTLSTLPDRLTITVVTRNLDGLPTSFLKILKKKEVVVRRYLGLDFWGLVRDNEVALFCPISEDGKVSGILTEDPRLVRLLRGEFLRESTQAKIVKLA